MPRISATEIPKITRGGKVSAYADEMAEFTELLGEENFGAGEACQFDIPIKQKDGKDVKDKDGNPVYNLDPLVTALRKAAKDVGRKMNSRSHDGKLYVQDGGEWTENAEDSENESAAAVRKGAKK